MVSFTRSDLLHQVWSPSPGLISFSRSTALCKLSKRRLGVYVHFPWSSAGSLCIFLGSLLILPPHCSSTVKLFGHDIIATVHDNKKLTFPFCAMIVKRFQVQRNSVTSSFLRCAPLCNYDRNDHFQLVIMIPQVRFVLTILSNVYTLQLVYVYT